jgi:hypothetical protein
MGAETSVASMVGGVPDRMEVNVCSVDGFISAFQLYKGENVLSVSEHCPLHEPHQVQRSL